MNPAAGLIGGGVNPARAGMILDFTLTLLALERKPRASGDDPDFSPMITHLKE